MENNDRGSQSSCFRQWMDLQQEDLLELQQALDLNADGGDHHTVELKHLAEKNVMHFQEYATMRHSLAREDVSSYFSPSWCSSLEGSMLWVGGCRPSIFIRLVYALSGREFELNLREYLQGRRINGGLDLSASQIRSINSLHLKTVSVEDKLSSELASLQEDMADQPIASMAQESYADGVPNREVNGALNKHDESMLNLLEEADNLRLSTMKEVISILTPSQAVVFLAAGKKLHLCLHEWGRMRDHEHGRH
ncbi:protein DOG1-like 3 [Primulina huaijiensis]|uniref:protein DOG1-like 3 n=1 Tax=Primulina huaijiensis TaxID=1492673 RepID=UPI003CC6F0A5